MPFLRVYFASKTTHATKWREVDLNSKNLKVTGRWVKQVIIDNGDLLQNAHNRDMSARCWIEDQQDIQCSDYLVLYAEEGEHLRGGLVEAGIAIEHGVPVILIGEHPDYSSWQWHPQTIHLSSLDILEEWAACEIATRMRGMKSTYDANH
jgi:hypothetical protein